jgi:hypothetical protein
MGAAIFLLALLVAGALWVWSIVSIPDTKTFGMYFLIHVLLIATYSYFWTSYSQLITGHDEYGLGKLIGYLLLLICHSFLGFIVLQFDLNRLKRNQ